MTFFPVSVPIGGSRVPIHLITDILSIALALVYYEYLKNRKGDTVNPDIRAQVLVGGALGALIGSRLLAALENPFLFFHPPSFLYYIYGKTIVGGLVGAIIGVEIAKKNVGEKGSTGDIFVYPLILGIIIGRMGCFLTGVSDRTVGLPSSLPWAIDQGDGILRHPTSLYEIIFLVLLWLVLKQLEKKNYKSGVLFKVFIISYFLFRFVIEFIKPTEPLVLGLSAIQLTSFIVAGHYTYKLFITSHGRQSNKTPTISRSHGRRL
jgi:prolipoprotein diacylglyceryltransferase